MSMMKIGTRASQMALAQTNDIMAHLARVLPALKTQAVPFRPRGDIDQTSKLDRHGGKGGAFVSEIRDAIRASELSAAMHSLKDVPGDEEAPGLVLGAYLRREAVEDALVLRADKTIDAFLSGDGAGFKIGTNSVRRAAYLRRFYPACEVIHYRGAADTRLRKLDEGALQKLPDGGTVGPADGLVMATSGLTRIGEASRAGHVFPAIDMIPAVGQGIVVVECAETDWKTRERLALIDDSETRICALAEREMLWVLNGHCNTPIAGHASVSGGRLALNAAVLSADGATFIDARRQGDPARPRELGRAVGLELLERGAAAIIAAG